MDEKLAQASQALTAGRADEAIELLNELHEQCHTEAWLHIRTHWVLARAHRQAGHYRRAAFEVIAMPFAGPASLLHKHLGIARKNL